MFSIFNNYFCQYGQKSTIVRKYLYPLLVQEGARTSYQKHQLSNGCIFSSIKIDQLCRNGFYYKWRIHKHSLHWLWLGKSVTIKSHFIQSYHCSSNRLEVTEKHRLSSFSFVILASHVSRKKLVCRGSCNWGHSTSIL